MQPTRERVEMFDSQQYREAALDSLRCLRLMGLNQSQIGKKLGVSPKVVANWYAENHLPNPDNLAKLIDLLVPQFTHAIGGTIGLLVSSAMTDLNSSWPDAPWQTPLLSEMQKVLNEAGYELGEFFQALHTGKGLPDQKTD